MSSPVLDQTRLNVHGAKMSTISLALERQTWRLQEMKEKAQEVLQIWCCQKP